MASTNHPPNHTASSSDSSPFAHNAWDSAGASPFSYSYDTADDGYGENGAPPSTSTSSVGYANYSYPVSNAHNTTNNNNAAAGSSSLNPNPYSYQPPGTSSGRPTTSSGLLNRPGTSTGAGGGNPFRQQAYQDAYGFHAGPPPLTGESSVGSSSYAGEPVFAPPPPSRRGRSRRGVSRGGTAAGVGVGVMGAGAGVMGAGGAYGIAEEDDDDYYGVDEDEEEEESEDEGLFAFLPPSTAEQVAEREAREREERERAVQAAQAPGGSGSSPFAYSVRQEGQGASALAMHHQHLQQQAQQHLQQQQQPPTTTTYDPPVSPPSTESNSGSRGGVVSAAGDEFKMSRLDGAGRRRSSESREGRPPASAPGSEAAPAETSRRSRESARARRSAERSREAAAKEGEEKEAEGEAGKEEAAATDGEDAKPVEEVYPRHFQHFQPNPARSNANSGPYKKHREYHYQQAYPQFAPGGGASGQQPNGSNPGASVDGSRAGTAGGAVPPSAGGTGYGSMHGYGGDYEDMERFRSNRERKRKQRRSGTATTGASELGGYGAGSEYSGPGQEGRRQGTGISEVEDERGSMSKRSVYFEGESHDGMYEDEEGYGDGDSREGSIKMEFDFDAIEDEDSPYPEVRASVSNIDDPDMPAMTIRMWFVGLVLCMASSAFNVFFNFRSPAPSIVPLVLLLLSYPVGKFLAFTLPITTYRIPLPCLPSRWLPASLPRSMMRVLRPITFPHAIEFSLNPGPWNIKEHVLVFIMANVAVGNPYALNAIVVLEVFYEFKTGYWFSLVLVLATQLTGFGLAGMCRRFLVWPASMVWPQNLVACTLLNTLHAEDEDDGIGMLGGPTMVAGESAEGGAGGVQRKKGMSRYRFFIYTMIGSFFFFFLPGYLFEALSFFSFVCWAAPDNVKVNQIFGVRTGLGMSVLTFDWTQISWIGSPLMVPWWAEVHIFAGFVLFYWIMTPILYYTNSWKLAHFPVSANGPYDRYGNPYNVAGVLKADGTFDEAAYDAYSPLFLPATYAVTYLLAFCLSTCVIVHTVLYHGHTLLKGFKKMRVENDDIHAKLMRNYPEVPDWWYACAFCSFFALAVVAVEHWDTRIPVWALLLSVLLPVIYILPSGFIYAMTGQGINLNILAQIIPGSLLPGQPLANMVFKSYSVQTLSEATSFIQDLKLGHYVKVPPRATFLVQLVATMLAAFVQVGVKQWIFDNVEDICQKNQKSQLTCPHSQVFYTASAVWGLIGPTRQFGQGSIYHWHLYAIAIGVVLPIPFWLWRRRYPNSWVKWVSTPVVLNGVSWIPPATGINYSSWFAVGFIFQYVVRKRNFAWWSKFNYVLSSALDSGTVIAVITIFFTLQFPNYRPDPAPTGVQLNWWGNLVHTETADWKGVRYLDIPEGGIPIPDRS